MFADKDSKKKTFRPKKAHKKGTRRFDLHKQTYATLGSGDVRAAVQLPPEEDLDEWLAMNTVDFFNEISLLYGTLVPFCTEETCPVMNAGSKYEYHWADGATIKTPIKVSAPEYIDLMMTWVEGQLNNEAIFPSSVDTPFPTNFKKKVKTIFKRMFRVHAHIYYNHFKKVRNLGAEAHLNSCFKHFIYFVLEFNLVDDKELSPLNELIENIKARDAERGATSTGEALPDDVSEALTTLDANPGRVVHSISVVESSESVTPSTAPATVAVTPVTAPATTVITPATAPATTVEISSATVDVAASSLIVNDTTYDEAKLTTTTTTTTTKEDVMRTPLLLDISDVTVTATTTTTAASPISKVEIEKDSEKPAPCCVIL